MAKSKRYVDPQAPLDGNNLPITSYGSIDSQYLPNYNTNNKGSQPYLGDTGSSYYTGDTYTSNNLDDTSTYKEDLPYINDIRSGNQGIVSSLGNDVGKFVGKTALYLTGGIGGTIYGVGSAIANGDVSKIWDNSFSNKVDDIDKGLDNIFKVYKSSDYLDQNFLQRAFLHPLQFVDDTTEALSFTAGAVLTELLTSGLGSEFVIPKAIKYMKYLSEGADAAEATKNLTSATRGILRGVGDFGTTIKQLATGASYESIVEARKATMDLRTKMYSDYANDHPGEDMPESVKADIDDRLSKAGLFTYFSNLALVGSTNMAEFPKIFGLGYKTSKVAEGAIEKDLATGLFHTGEKEFKNLSTLEKAGVLLKNPYEEGIKEEGLQDVISNTNQQFFDRKNDDKSKNIVNRYLATVAHNLADTYTSKEGWNDIGMGMLIGTLGAPGRGSLAILGKDNPIGKYGFDEVRNDQGEVTGQKRADIWTGGIIGSIDEHNSEVQQVQSIVDDLNNHTDLFKSMKANYDFLVESQSLQDQKEKALDANDIFNFQNAKDDQIHSYVASRIKANKYEDILDTIDSMKKLSPDEFYTQFRGEEATNSTPTIEKSRFQQESIQEFTEKAKNTKNAYDIVDENYKGDNDNIREELAHSIAASKNLDIREKDINQSIADLSDGLISNYNLRGNNDSFIKGNIDFIKDQLKQENLSQEDKDSLNKQLTDNTRALQSPELAALLNLKENNPTAYTINGNKILDLLSDSKKLREKRQNYLDLYNHLFTEKGQKDFQKHIEDVQEINKKIQEQKQTEEENKIVEKEKKDNIKETVDKANSIKNEDIPNVSFEEDKPSLVLDTEEKGVVDIEIHKETTSKKDSILSEDGLVKNPNENISDSERLTNLKIINIDRKRSLGNVIAYLGQNKTSFKSPTLDNVIITSTDNIYNEDGSAQINKNVDVKLFSQNFYKEGDTVNLFVPTFSEMKERGLDDYTEDNYTDSIDTIEEFPIAIKGEDNKILGYLPTQSGIKRLVADEFKEQALKSNLDLRKNIFENKDKIYTTTITSKSPGYLILDQLANQKSLFEALGNKTKLADKVKIGIVKLGELRLNNSKRGLFVDGEIINSPNEEGVVYSIVPSSETNKYISYPMKINSIGVDNANTIVEAIRLFANRDNLNESDKQSLANITEFNFKNFDDVAKFVNKIMYSSAKANATENTIFKLYKDNLVLSAINDQKFRLKDVIGSQAIRDELVSILSQRYYSVSLDNLNSNKTYISYSLENEQIIEKEYTNYQSYLDSNKVITSNIRGIHIEENEFAFTTQPVIGIASKTDEIEETKEVGIATEAGPRLTKKTLFDPKKVKPKPLEDINPEFIERQNIQSGDDLRHKCL